MPIPHSIDRPILEIDKIKNSFGYFRNYFCIMANDVKCITSGATIARTNILVLRAV